MKKLLFYFSKSHLYRTGFFYLFSGLIILFACLTFYSNVSGLKGISLNGIDVFMVSFGLPNYTMRYLIPAFAGFMAYYYNKSIFYRHNIKTFFIDFFIPNTIIMAFPLVTFLVFVCLLYPGPMNGYFNAILGGPFIAVADNNIVCFIILLLIHYIIIFNVLIALGLSIKLSLNRRIFILIIPLLICNIYDFIPYFIRESPIGFLIPLYPTDVVAYTKSLLKYIYDIVLLLSITIFFVNRWHRIANINKGGSSNVYE